MSNLDGRANRLYLGLTARERAILVLQAANDDRQPDHGIYAMMPDGQAAEFNSYMTQLRGINQRVGPYILVLAEEIAHSNTKAVLLGVLCSWGYDRSEFVNYIGWQTDEPCTQEELDQHVAEARTESLPLDSVVDAVIEARDLWTDEPDEAPIAQAARFKRLTKPIEAEIRQLVVQGRLDGRGRGASLTIRAGSLYDWLGLPVAAGPEWGRGYRVVPDAEVGWRRESRERVQAQVKGGPHSPLHVLEHLPPSSAWLLNDDDLTAHDRLMRRMADRVRMELARLAGAVGAVDVVLEEMRESFNGVDLLPPPMREVLESGRAELKGTCDFARALIGDFSFPDSNEWVLEQLRGTTPGSPKGDSSARVD
jgi:hypothetical protein